MAYMNTMDATDDDDFFGPDDSVYAESIEDLRKQADLVIKKLAGSVKTDENGEPYLAEKSFLRMASEPRTDGQVRCLVNDKVYAKSMLNNTTHPRYLGMFPRSVERDDVHLYKFSSSINLAQWKQMWENLPQVRNVKNFEQAASVWKELLAMGFDQGGPERSDLSIGNYKNHGDSLTKWYGSHYHSSIVAVGDASYTKTVDQTAVKHYRETRLDTYNLANGTIKYDTAISYHYETYLVSPVWWGYEHRLYPVTSVL